MRMPVVSSFYMSEAHVDLAGVVEITCGDIKRRHFDIIVVRGISGLIVGAPVSIQLGKKLLVIRKSLDNCHSHSYLEGWTPARNTRYIILDDFIDTGRTIREILHALRHYEGYFAGMYEWKWERWNTRAQALRRSEFGRL